MLWCHNCQKQTNFSEFANVCCKCGSGAIENSNNIDHMPNSFRPYVIGAQDQIPRVQSTRTEDEEYEEVDIPIMLNIRTVVMESLDRPGEFTVVRLIASGLPAFPEMKTPVSADILDKLEKVQSIKECTVCQEEGGKGVKLNCSHCFHENCVKPWFEQTNTCPTCRTLVQ